MEEQKMQPNTISIDNTKSLVAMTAVVTSTAIVTIGAWRVAAELVHPSIRRLRTRLEKKAETTN